MNRPSSPLRPLPPLLLVLLLCAAPARAGGLFVPDVGTRALARGGAFVASVSSTDTDKQGVSAGLGLSLGRFRLSAAYAHVFFSERTVSDSTMRLINPLKPGEGNVVGNGAYRFGHDLLSVGAQASF